MRVDIDLFCIPCIFNSICFGPWMDPIKTKNLNRILSYFFPWKVANQSQGNEEIIWQCNACIWSFCQCEIIVLSTLVEWYVHSATAIWKYLRNTIFKERMRGHFLTVFKNKITVSAYPRIGNVSSYLPLAAN